MNEASVRRVNPSKHHWKCLLQPPREYRAAEKTRANSRSRPNCGCVGTRVRITNQRKCHPVVCTGLRVHTPPPPRCSAKALRPYEYWATCNLTSPTPPPSCNERRIRSTVQTPRLVHPAAILLPLRHRRIIIRLCSSIRPDRGHLRERRVGEMILIFKSEV